MSEDPNPESLAKVEKALEDLKAYFAAYNFTVEEKGMFCMMLGVDMMKEEMIRRSGGKRE